MNASGTDSLCPIVRLEWDRGHETLDAIVRARSDSGIVITELRDCNPLNGMQWIDAAKLLYVDDLDEDDPNVRLAELPSLSCWTMSGSTTATLSFIRPGPWDRSMISRA